uniref:Uncharacterized protein n=1 Tax=Avena sativa TaxID=4498 RepID=A0ACD5UVD3_AVESA
MAFPTSALPPVHPPKCFALISTERDNSFHDDDNNRLYLQTTLAALEHTDKFDSTLWRNDDDDLEAAVPILTDPTARFYVEMANKAPGYVHIRCGYNNKYWVPEEAYRYLGGDRDFMLIGTTPEREEDIGNKLCTLFRLNLTIDQKDGAGNNTFKARFIAGASQSDAFIFVAKDNSLHKDFFIRDLSDHVVLPRHVAFKGDNGKYLSARQVHGRPYCQFSSQDITDPSVMFTTFYNDDGTVRIKSEAYGKFLRLSPAWIWPDGPDNPSDKNTLFKVTRIDDYYLLKNLGNNHFCKRLTADNKSDCLNAATEHVMTEAKLWVEEPVLSREIYNITYHGLDKARVYDSKTVNMASSSAINATSQNNNVKMSLTITQTQSRTWDTSLSTKIGVKTTITASVPQVGSIGEELSAEVESGFSFGKTEVTETKQEIVYDVVVPTMKKVIVSAIATQAKCDVPYSYAQKDIMPSGEVIVSTLHDGMYSGKNTFNLQYVTTEEDLPAEFLKKGK